MCVRKRVINYHIYNFEKLWTIENNDYYDDFILFSCQRKDIRIIKFEISYKLIFNREKNV